MIYRRDFFCVVIKSVVLCFSIKHKRWSKKLLIFFPSLRDFFCQKGGFLKCVVCLSALLLSPRKGDTCCQGQMGFFSAFDPETQSHISAAVVFFQGKETPMIAVCSTTLDLHNFTFVIFFTKNAPFFFRINLFFWCFNNIG